MSIAHQPSKLTPLIFERLEDTSSITVFDVGGAVSETVNFFSDYRCKLTFSDLFADEFVEQQDPDLSDDEIASGFSDLLTLRSDTRVDVCLLWDFLNYLTTPYLKGFGAALAPFLHKDTLAHGFGVLNSSTSLKSQRYGLSAADQLVVRPRQVNGLKYYPHPQSDIEKWLPQFSMNRRLLLDGGQLEMLLSART